MREKVDHWIRPEPVVVKELLFVRVLLEMESVGDFVSSMLSDWLVVGRELQGSSVPSQSAIQRSRSKENMAFQSYLTIRSKHQGVIEELTSSYFRIKNHNAVLDAQQTHSHSRVIGNDEGQSPRSSTGAKLMLTSLSVEKLRIGELCEQLRELLCTDPHEIIHLSFFRVSNYAILLTIKSKTHLWGPFGCSKAFRAQCARRRIDLSFANESEIQVVTLITLTHWSTPKLTVADLRVWKEHNRDLISPLLGATGLLRCATMVMREFHTICCVQSAFKQIHLVPEDNENSTLTKLEDDTSVDYHHIIPSHPLLFYYIGLLALFINVDISP